MDLGEDLKRKLDAELASTTETVNLNMAFSVWLSEVARLLTLVRTWWSPRWDEEIGREAPGFASLGLDEDILAESEFLMAQLRDWARSYRVLPRKAWGASRVEAQTLLTEVGEVARWLAQKEPDLRFAIDTLRDSQRSLGRGLPDYATRLEGLAAVTLPFTAELDGLAGFDAASIDACLVVAEKIRTRPSPFRAREGRNRMTVMLSKRVQRLRTGGKLVFRKHPHLAAQLALKPSRRPPAEALANATEG